jgi:hypothetical protein
MSKFHRVYDIWKDKRRLRTMNKHRPNIFLWAPGFDKELNLYSKAWFQAIKNNQIEQQVIAGQITGVEGGATDGRSFPVFTLESADCVSTWERKSHAGFLSSYSDDKYYQCGKNVEVTFARCKRESGTKHEADAEKFSKVVLFVDVER